MATPIFKCIHAADLHLEQVCTGLDHIPVDFIDPLLDAPYLATESIFTAAIVCAAAHARYLFFCAAGTANATQHRLRHD